MGLFDHFPYTNFHELNLDWILNALKELEHTIEQFVAINALKYADPIQWNITSQYEKNTIVIDPLTGTAYISVQPVPSGVAITNTDYWTVVFDLGSFVVRAAKNFTDKWEAETTLTATFPSNVNDWLIWGDVLYRVISPIVAGDQYVIGSNIVHFTAEDIIGHIEDLTTIDKTNLVAAINEVLQILTDTAGDLDDLFTTDKSNLVAAINEIFDIIGDKDNLTTSNKTNIVSAINELDTALREIVDVTRHGVDNTGTTDCTSILQDIIDNNPHAIIYFPNGTYLISNTITTPSEYNKLVTLLLAEYATIKADDSFPVGEFMIDLCGTGIGTPDNNYIPTGIKGGIIDCNNVASGIIFTNEKDGNYHGSRAFISNLYIIKAPYVGIRIGRTKRSSDVLINDVTVSNNNTNNYTSANIALYVYSNDNDIYNFRTYLTVNGILCTGDSNLFVNCHPVGINSGTYVDFGDTYGFKFASDTVPAIIKNNIRLVGCYSDNYGRSFWNEEQNAVKVTDCSAYWYEVVGNFTRYCFYSETINSAYDIFAFDISNFKPGLKPGGNFVLSGFNLNDNLYLLKNNISMGSINGLMIDNYDLQQLVDPLKDPMLLATLNNKDSQTVYDYTSMTANKWYPIALLAIDNSECVNMHLDINSDDLSASLNIINPYNKAVYDVISANSRFGVNYKIAITDEDNSGIADKRYRKIYIMATNPSGGSYKQFTVKVTANGGAMQILPQDAFRVITPSDYEISTLLHSYGEATLTPVPPVTQTVLYNSQITTPGTVTLSDNATNYKWIVVEWYASGSGIDHRLYKVLPSTLNGMRTQDSIVSVNSNNDILMNMIEFSFTGTSFEFISETHNIWSAPIINRVLGIN